MNVQLQRYACLRYPPKRRTFARKTKDLSAKKNLPPIEVVATKLNLPAASGQDSAPLLYEE